MTSSAQPPATPDEAAILRLIAAWAAAIETRDPEGIVAAYTDDSVLFDAIPPYRTIGKTAIRQAWASCLPCFPEQFRTEHRDLSVHVAGDTAWAHWLLHFQATPPEHPCGQTWMRVSAGYQRIGGTWKVLHEHVSIPFNPLNNQAWFITDPAVADAPDYGLLPGAGAPA